MNAWILSAADLSLIVKDLHKKGKLVCRLSKDGSVEVNTDIALLIYVLIRKTKKI